MGDTYSLYEAKARLSEIVRRVREGQTITISYHGKPVAEVRPIAPESASIEEHFRKLEERGVLVPARRPFAPIKPVAKRPGALKRFLRDRNRF
ncbi:MAG: type II toxin-antitoxin system prevent-host-death family antitoxin [Gemmatimonadetes bacterium]|nr:type II toxin-antitoxin system prevent-host-death family antitoxin [Gemmatimonadota bacterium]